MTLSADLLSYSYSGPSSAFARSATADKKGGHSDRPSRAGHGGGSEFALREVSLTVAPGSLTGLLGPNGCGKTTLLKLLSGVFKPELGSVRLGQRVL